MEKIMCENCGHVWECDTRGIVVIFYPDCPKCGSQETGNAENVVKDLTEYEMSQEMGS